MKTIINNEGYMNNDKTSLSRYILVILCVSIVFTALVLIVLNSWVQNKRLSSIKSGIPAVDQVLFGQSYEDGYKEGYMAARTKYQRMMPLPEGVPILNLTGNIQSIGNNQITIKAENLDVDEIVDGISNVRTVLISTTTKILLRKSIDSAEHMKLVQEWSKNSEDGPPPSPYTEKEIGLGDLKVDQMIAVSADEDIKLLPSFTALEVVYYEPFEVVPNPTPEPLPTAETTSEPILEDTNNPLPAIE